MVSYYPSISAAFRAALHSLLSRAADGGPHQYLSWGGKAAPSQMRTHGGAFGPLWGTNLKIGSVLVSQIEVSGWVRSGGASRLRPHVCFGPAGSLNPDSQTTDDATSMAGPSGLFYPAIYY